MKWQRRLNIALTVALSTAFILLGAFVFRVAYCRTFEALIDLYGGLSDIENKIIRTVGNAEERFSEDSLRILRAVRFSSLIWENR